MADQLVTLAQVKARVEVSDASDDTVLSELIDQVSDWIQWHTSRRFLPENAATYVLDTASGSRVAVPRGIRAVTSISYATSDQPDAGGAYTAISSTNVLLRPSALERRPGWPATMILIRGTTPVFANATNGVTITGDFGFAAVPPVIQGVTIDAVVAAFVARQADASEVAGPDASPVATWARYFAPGTVQRATVDRFRPRELGFA